MEKFLSRNLSNWIEKEGRLKTEYRSLFFRRPCRLSGQANTRKIALLFRDGHDACRFVFLLSGIGRFFRRADGCGRWRRRAVADSRIVQPIAKRYACGLGDGCQ